MLKTQNGTPVSVLSLGGAALGSCHEKLFFGKPVSDKQAIETILFALSNGINLIDTSPFYGDSERKIGYAMDEIKDRKSILLSTKAGTHPSIKGYSADILKRSIENSLKLLRTDYLDIVHIHDPGMDDFEKVMDKGGGIEALTELRYQGVIRKIGLGVRDHKLHSEFIDSGFADVILPYLDYNLLSQGAGSLLEHARNNDIPVLLGSPLCMGLLSGNDPSKLNISHFDIGKEVSLELAHEMYAYCRENNLDLMAVNYAFIRQNPAITSIITGSVSIEEITQNIQSFNRNIPESGMTDFLNHFNLAAQII